MKTENCLSILFLLVLANHFCFAQDTINKKRQKIEIGLTSQIQFKNFEYNSELVQEKKVNYNTYVLTPLNLIERTTFEDNKTASYGWGINLRFIPFKKYDFLYFETNLNYLKNYNNYYFLNYGYHTYNSNGKRYIEFDKNYYNIKVSYFRPDLFIGFKNRFSKTELCLGVGIGRNFNFNFTKHVLSLENDEIISTASYNRRDYNKQVYSIFEAYPHSLKQNPELYKDLTRLDYNEFMLKSNISYYLTNNIKINCSYILSYQEPLRPITFSYSFYNSDKNETNSTKYFLIHNYEKKIFSTYQINFSYEF